MKHTPGPWEIKDGTPIRIIGDCKYIGFIAQQAYCVDSLSPERPEAEANAQLIAAAPYLLEACKSFVENYRTSEDMVTAFRLANDAIAKVQGAINGTV